MALFAPESPRGWGIVRRADRLSKEIHASSYTDGYARLSRAVIDRQDGSFIESETLAQRRSCQGERPTCPDCADCSLNCTLPELEERGMKAAGPGALLMDPEWKDLDC